MSSEAKDISVRLEVIRLRKLKMSYVKIASQLLIHHLTVRSYIKRYELDGESGLVTRHSNCGKTRIDLKSHHSYRMVRYLKYRHPTWGVAYILMKIKEAYPEMELLSERQYQRHLKSEGLGLLRNKRPSGEGYYDKAPHEAWQVDAKERLKLEDGSVACYLTIVDEGSGAILEAPVFPL
jgi:Winged helix-turn helix